MHNLKFSELEFFYTDLHAGEAVSSVNLQADTTLLRTLFSNVCHLLAIERNLVMVSFRADDKFIPPFAPD